MSCEVTIEQENWACANDLLGLKSKATQVAQCSEDPYVDLQDEWSLVSAPTGREKFDTLLVARMSGVPEFRCTQGSFAFKFREGYNAILMGSTCTIWFEEKEVNSVNFKSGLAYVGTPRLIYEGDGFETNEEESDEKKDEGWLDTELDLGDIVALTFSGLSVFAALGVLFLRIFRRVRRSRTPSSVQRRGETVEITETEQPLYRQRPPSSTSELQSPSSPRRPMTFQLTQV